MAFTIDRGSVKLRAPDGKILEDASMDDVAFLVVEPQRLFNSGRQCWFTDIACNSAIQPAYEDDPAKLEDHVDWALFDDRPT